MRKKYLFNAARDSALKSVLRACVLRSLAAHVSLSFEGSSDALALSSMPSSSLSQRRREHQQHGSLPLSKVSVTNMSVESLVGACMMFVYGGNKMNHDRLVLRLAPNLRKIFNSKRGYSNKIVLCQSDRKLYRRLKGIDTKCLGD